MRLGQALVKMGLVTFAQLEEATERQVACGGRLGSNLLELGALSEEALAKALSILHEVPYAEPAKLDTIEPRILFLVSADFAIQHRVIPFERDRTGLYLAMMDPKDPAPVEALRKTLGCEIRPRVAVELRILYALHRFYKAPLLPRFNQLPVFFQGQRGKAEEPKPDVQRIQTQWEAARGKARPGAAPGDSESDAVFVQPRDREAVCRALLRAVGARVKRTALFTVRDECAFGWLAAVPGLDGATFALLEFPLAAPSILRDVVQRREFYRGAFLPLPENLRLAAALGGPPPQEALAYPLIVRDKVICVLYGDDGPQNLLLGGFEDLQKVAMKAAMALQVLILQQKIRNL
ncbi:MAG: hypothetical protein HY575_02865 [candidate division NC10 bacterium]|nr:hypothetical protein [candidate division NC10 bacterium]MBI4390800.1 hypothetical protein [candidate division NC10 bacterium]